MVLACQQLRSIRHIKNQRLLDETQEKPLTLHKHLRHKNVNAIRTHSDLR